MESSCSYGKASLLLEAAAELRNHLGTARAMLGLLGTRYAKVPSPDSRVTCCGFGLLYLP